MVPMNISDLQHVLRDRADDASTDPADIDRLIGKGKARRRTRRLATVASAIAVIGAAVAIPLLVSGGSTVGDAPATLVPTGSPATSPSPSVSTRPTCGAPVACQGPPIPPATTALAVPNVTFQTGISDNGPQISATRWMNVNSWNTPVSVPLYLDSDPFLAVYAGGATIDPSLKSDATWAAVLVITPQDYYRFEQRQVAFLDVGTIYRPPSGPQGKLKVISVSGGLLTLNLVGTSQNYVFNAATDTFQ